MARDRKLSLGIWLLTTVVVAGVALLVYHCATRVDDLAGRSDPAAIYEDPGLLFSDPGLLGSAVEERVTKAVRDCMEQAGLQYRGPAVITGLSDILEGHGYGIAAGPAAPAPRLGTGGGSDLDEAYEQALYGAGLAEGGEVGGCAAAGRRALDDALATLESLPYSIDQLEADAQAHPAYQRALADWSKCMATGGYAATSPEDLVQAQVEALAGATAEEAATLADEERALAAADFACRRRTLDPAIEEVAADLAPAFVEANRPQLEALIPSTGTVVPEDEGLGTGDVQVTLRWSSSVDLDLSVVDPGGDAISYSTRTSPSGGELDRDANYPCETATSQPVENIFWPPGAAPSGNYQVTVTYRTGCGDQGPQAYRLLVRLDGVVVEDVQATIDPGQQVTIEITRGEK